MPAYTEARIRRLCAKIMSIEDEVELSHLLKELRHAIQEHLRLAKETLEAKASVIPVLQNLLQNRDKNTPEKSEE